MIIVGIDPGFGGGVGFLEYDPASVNDPYPVGVADAPIFEKKGKRYLDYAKMLQLLEPICDGEQGVVVIEKVGPRPQQGVSSAFRFGYGAGMWHGVAAHYYPHFAVEFVTPNTWKRDLGLSSDKEKSLVLTRQMWPEMKPYVGRKKDDGRAEALLIGYWWTKFGVKRK